VSGARDTNENKMGPYVPKLLFWKIRDHMCLEWEVLL
jgi:hypothetical protein